MCRLVFLIVLLALPLQLRAQEGFDASPILQSSKTIIGQPIKYPDTDSPEITTVLVRIKPGGESGRHKHPTSPLIYVISGTVTIEFDDGKSQTIEAGNAFIEAVDTWHNAKNLGQRPVKMLVTFFGEKGKKNMLRPD